MAVPWLGYSVLPRLSARAERIARPARHHARQIGLALDRLGRRKQVRPFLHFGDAFATKHHFVGYWGNKGQRAVLELNGSAECDPKRSK